MCGIVGVAGVLGLKDVAVAKDLLYFDYVRGKDSVGIGCVHENTGEVRVRKSVLDPVAFMDLKSVDSVFNSMNKVIMGHNRHATRGKVTQVNAHPYWTGRILGAHNGTLPFGCLKDLSKNVDAETDSEQLMYTIHDLDGSIPDALQLAEGAWALSIYDAENNTINLVRNKERPLYYCMSKSKKTLYWASEAWMLTVALSRHGIEREGIVEIEEDKLLSWGIPNSREVFADEPEITPAEGKQRVNFRSDTDETPWLAWGPYGGQGGHHRSNYRDPRESASGNGGDILRASKRPVEDTDWDIWCEGYNAQCEGKKLLDNPYVWTTDPNKWDDWRDGYQDGVSFGKTDDVLTTQSRKKAKAADAKVIQLDDKRPADSKRSTIYDTRLGPNKERLTPSRFREITNNCECSWCNNPITFEDKGQFITTPAHGSIYVCEDCVSNGDFSEEIKEAQASAK